MIYRVPGWPTRRLTVPRYAQHYILPADMFPKSLWDDVDALLTVAEASDLLSARPVRHLKPRTIRQYRYELRRFASALVHRGQVPAKITSLAYLVDIGNAEDGLRFFLERSNGQPMRSAAEIATLLGNIASQHVNSSPDDVSTLRRFAKNLMPKVGAWGAKNTQRLRALRDPRNIVRLFVLPRTIAADVARSQPPSREDALAMQLAVALAILTYAPLRIGNLAGLRVDRHLRWSGPSMAGELVIELTANEVKNRQALSFPVPKSVVDLIRTYLRHYHGLLVTGANPHVFPSDLPGRSKRSDTLGKQMTRLIHSSIGLSVNPHLYRHLVHIIVLNRFPGAYPMVSRILGHSSLQTAVRNYASEDFGIAMRAFQDLVNDLMATGNVARVSPAEVAYGLSPRPGR